MRYLVGVTLALFSLTALAKPATIYVGGGTSVSNSIKDSKSNAWIVYQQTPTKYGLWNFGYLNEGHKYGDKRDGIFAQYVIPYQFSKRVQTSFAIGPYFTATTVTQPDQIHYYDSYHWSLLPKASINYKLNKHFTLNTSWSHVIFARNNKDTDVFLFSIGYNP